MEGSTSMERSSNRLIECIYRLINISPVRPFLSKYIAFGCSCKCVTVFPLFKLPNIAVMNNQIGVMQFFSIYSVRK